MVVFKCKNIECKFEKELISLNEDITTSTGCCPVCGEKNWEIINMAKKNIVEQELTLKWVMSDDKIVKFNELDETFDISDAVSEFDFEKAGVKAGSKVSVKIDNDQGEHGVVVFMTKSKNQEKSPPPSSENSSEENKKTVKTVKAYGLKYDGSLLFTDNEKEWYSCDKSIGVDNISQFKGKTVEIEETVSKAGKKIVKSIKLVEGASSQSGESNQQKSKNSYTISSDARQTSIEAQASVNHANITVAGLFAGKFDASKKEDGVLVKSLIESIAKKNYQIIQDLKKLG